MEYRKNTETYTVHKQQSGIARHTNIKLGDLTTTS